MSHEDDDFFNSSNAYPSTTAAPGEQASWNPALRRNSEVPNADDDFFARVSGAEPQQSDIAEQPILQEQQPESATEDPSRRQSISVQNSVDVSHANATPWELEDVPSNHAEVEGPPTRQSIYEEEDDEALMRPQDEEGAILDPQESAEEQRHTLEDQMPETWPGDVEATQDVEGGVQQADHAAAAAQSEGELAQIPSENYEHQGEVTEMEEAIEPSAEDSLMENEEPLPTSDTPSRAPTMEMPSEESTTGFDGAPAPGQPEPKSPVARPQVDRSFSTNFSDSPIESQQQQQQQQEQEQLQQSVPDEWPAVGDDKTFGELLDNQQGPTEFQKAEFEGIAAEESARTASPDRPPAMLAAFENAAAQESAQTALDDDDLLPEEEGEIKEEDLAAAWGAAMDDDELLLEETPADLDPSQFFGEDGDGFLEDELAAPAQQQSQSQPQPQQKSQSQPQQRNVQSNQYTPASFQPQTPQQPSQFGTPNTNAGFFDPGSHGRSAGTPSTGLFDIYNTGVMQQQQPQQPERPSAQSSQSFVDKAKGGYESPYDLPMEVVKPRRRPQAPPQQQMSSSVNRPQPPPRSSSMSGNAPMTARPPSSGQPPRTAGSGSSMSPPPQSSQSAGPPPQPPGTAPASGKSTPKTGSGFFEDLPMVPKPRARPTGAYTQQVATPGVPAPPPSGPPQPPSRQGSAVYTPQQPPSRQGSAYMPAQQPGLQQPGMQQPGTQQSGVQQSGMQQPAMQQPPSSGMYGNLSRPDQIPLLPEQPMSQSPQPSSQPMPPQHSKYSPNSQAAGSLPAPAPPAAQSRYSPAPPAPAGAPASRYSPAPGAQPMQGKSKHPSIPSTIPASTPPAPHPFAPRTSSPLAGMQTDKPHPPLPPEARGLPSSPPRANGVHQTPPMMSPEFRQPSRYAPSEAQRASEPPTTFAPPQRPRTQSPDTTMKTHVSHMQPALTRAMSTADMSAAQQQQQQPAPRGPALPQRRRFSRDLTFVAPQDERIQDPLERWKGNPIFKWSASGTIVSTFPKQTPFYSAGQAMPSVKCTQGAITVQDASTFMPMDDRNAKFPGPLTAKSKRQKKDVVAWLAGKIEDLEKQAEIARLDFSTPPDMKKRVEEKPILWKIVHLFVEHDGVLEGNPKLDEEIRRILLPNLSQIAQVADLQSPASATLTPDPVDKQIIFQIRQALLEGQRERAVWLAEEKKLWGHAMLIASTMGPDIWKQIIGAFVRSQVKSVGSDARSTAALYQVFAGNAEECVDELVPPSARAGFQMISKSDGTKSGNPLEGLDQWRETLGLITSNRTANDGPSLLSLGKLLSSYGRVEAAHTCFLFARQFVKHSGADDAEGHFVLLGANHQAQDENFGNDLDSILLTEVFEYACSLSAPSTAANYIPHLQAFKLVHAQQLATHGLKTQAQTYCDHITSAYTSTTRPSPYYHPTFTQAVADLGAFLSQTPHDGKSGFFSKPAMNKVSSGAASWFSKFVAGEDDQESTGSGPGAPGSEDMAGPFGRVNGESPSISRQASTTDLYNPMMAGGGMQAPGMMGAAPPQTFTPGSTPSRYAPPSQASSGRYAPASSGSYSSHGMPAAEPQRPNSSRYAPAPSANLGVPRPDVGRPSSENSMSYAPSSGRGSAQETTSSQGSYEPKPVFAEDGSTYSYSPQMQAQPPPAVQEPQEPQDAFAPPNGLGLSEAGPMHAGEDDGGVDPETGGGYMPPTGGYEQPAYSTGGYEPPSNSYQPYEPEPASPEQPAKKKTFGDEDEDDDVARRAAALKKAEADREADDAFKKAAEADAAREKEKAEQKKGWLTGWFGGKKDPQAGPGPIRAKLGEENSFYYDENLKKWINKKGGPEAATPAAATPPPPKGPASRVASASGMPPSGPPSRVASGTGPPTSGPGSAGPPSRTETPASSDSAPAPPLGGGDSSASLAAPPSLGPRPSSSLSTASSIDELLGSGPRKGGTVKGKKKGGRGYVDVMAK